MDKKNYPVYMRRLSYGFILRVTTCSGKRPSDKYYEQVATIEAKSKRLALREISRKIKAAAPQENPVGAYTILWRQGCVSVSVKVRKSTWHGNHQPIGYLHAPNPTKALEIMENRLIDAMGEKVDNA